VVNGNQAEIEMMTFLTKKRFDLLDLIVLFGFWATLYLLLG